MAKVSYPQLLQEIADAYRIASETTDKVTVKELPTQISQLFNRLLCNSYKSIEYNEDNTITLIDHEDVAHTITPTYDIGKVSSVKFDDKVVDLGFDGDQITSIDNKVVDIGYAPKSENINAFNYKTITYNEDNSITLIDSDDIEHKIICKYDENDKIKSISFDGQFIALDYSEEMLEGIGAININVDKAPGNMTVNSTAQKPITIETNIVEVILPVNTEPITVEINSSSISVETSVVLESEE
jgi:hypothetical protein